MKFGMMAFNVGGHGRSAEQVFRENLEQCAHADELGFDAIWLPEHHFSEYSLVTDPLVYGVAVAERTTRVRIGTAVLVLPVHNPVRVAENAAFLDVLSGGRLDVGIGRGYQPGEFLGFDVPLEESREVYDEAIDYITRMWTEDVVDFDGKYFKGQGVSILPRPLQQPHPPLWRAAVSPSTFSAAGQAGEAILTSPNFTPVDVIQQNFTAYREALTAEGYDPAAYEYPLMQQVYVGGDPDDAYNTPQRHAMAYYELLGRLLPGDAEVGKGDYAFYDKVRRNVQDLRYDYLYEHGVNFGTPEAVQQKLQMLIDIAGIDYYIAWFNFAGMEHTTVMRSMERFAEDVISHFTDDRSAGAGGAVAAAE